MRILPEIGLDMAPDGTLRFGMTREQVLAMLGEPEQRSDESGDDESGDGPTADAAESAGAASEESAGGDVIEAWYYWTRGVALSFDEEADWRLCTIEVTFAEAELEGRQPIGMSFAELTAALPAAELQWEQDEDEPASIDAWSMNLWIEDDEVTSVQWSVGFDDDDHERWPS